MPKKEMKDEMDMEEKDGEEDVVAPVVPQPYVRPSMNPMLNNRNLVWKWVWKNQNFWWTQIRRSTSRGR